MSIVPPPQPSKEQIKTEIAYSDNQIQLLKITNSFEHIEVVTYQLIMVPGVALATAIVGMNDDKKSEASANKEAPKTTHQIINNFTPPKGSA